MFSKKLSLLQQHWVPKILKYIVNEGLIHDNVRPLCCKTGFIFSRNFYFLHHPVNEFCCSFMGVMRLCVIKIHELFHPKTSTFPTPTLI